MAMESIDYIFNDDHKLFQKNVREFAQGELAPGYLKRAKIDHFDMDIYKKLADFGLLGFKMPEEYGGQGDAMDFVAMGIAAEEVGRADLSMGYALLSAGNTLQMVLNYAPQKIKDDFIPEYVAGEVLLGMALTEASGGTDLAGMKTTALRDGDYYILNGEKSSNSFVNAPYHIIYAKTNPDAGYKGVSAIWVPVPEEDNSNISRSVFGDIGCKPIRRGAITFKNFKVPVENLMHEEGKAFKMAVKGEDSARPLLTLICLGCAQAALDDAIAYSRQRVVFGKPIAAYEGISYPIAEAQTLIDACRLMCFDALWKSDHDIPFSKEACMVKWWGPGLAFKIIKQCLLVFGHFGYCDEYTVAQRMVDVMGLEIGGGTEHLNKLLVAQHLIGRVVRN